MYLIRLLGLSCLISRQIYTSEWMHYVQAYKDLAKYYEIKAYFCQMVWIPQEQMQSEHKNFLVCLLPFCLFVM